MLPGCFFYDEFPALPVGGVVDAQALDAGSECPRGSQVRVGRVLGLGELRQRPVWIERRDEILDLHVDGVADLDPVAKAIVDGAAASVLNDVWIKEAQLQEGKLRAEPGGSRANARRSFLIRRTGPPPPRTTSRRPGKPWRS